MLLAQLMNRRVASNRSVGQVCGGAFSIVGVFVLILGFRRLEQMELTEAQLYSATIETLLLAAVFIALALFFGWREVR